MEPFDYVAYAENDTSDAGPALRLAGVTGGPLELLIGWTGAGNGHPNVMPVVVRPDGTMYFDTERKVTLADRAAGGLALAGGGESHWRETSMAWTIDNSAGELNSIIGATLDAGLSPVRELVSFEWSDHTPALEVFSREVNVAWTGVNNQQINCAPLVFDSEGGGWVFSSQRKSVSAETSEFEPALSWRPIPNELWVAWAGEGEHELNVMRCHLGPLDAPQPYRTVFDRATKHTFASETSDAGPGLLARGNSFLLTYRGSGNNNLNVLSFSAENYSVLWKHTSGRTTDFQPAISYGPEDQAWVYVAWTGEDDHLNVGRLALNL